MLHGSGIFVIYVEPVKTVLSEKRHARIGKGIDLRIGFGHLIETAVGHSVAFFIKVTACFGPAAHSDQSLDMRILFFVFIKQDRKSTRLNSSHVRISYAVFCLKKKK